MKLLSVNVARAEEVSFGDVTVKTSIVKKPVEGAVFLSREGLAGDGMANPMWDGHRRPALYAYPVEHYHHWSEELGMKQLAHGKFGENVTTEGLLESEVCAGDVFQMGSAVVQAVGFRIPCRNLALTMNDSRFVLRFRNSGRPGIFFNVIKEGEIAAGDEARLLERIDEDFTIAGMASLYYSKNRDKSLVDQLLAKPFLPGTVKKDFT